MGIDILGGAMSALDRVSNAASEVKAKVESKLEKLTGGAATGVGIQEALPESVKKTVKDGFEGAVKTAKQGVQKAKQKLDDAGEKLDALTGGAATDVGIQNALPELTKFVMDKVKQAHNTAGPEAGRAVKEAADGANVPKQIDELEDGEKTTFWSEIETPSGKMRQKFEVRRSDEVNPKTGAKKPRYLLSVEGGFATPGDIGVSAGGKQEFAFKSSADAKKGLQIMGKMQAQGGLREGSDAVGTASKEEWTWLTKHTSSIEVQGGAQVMAAGEGAVLEGKLGPGAEGGVRIEYENGKPARVVVRGKASLDAQGGSRFGLATGQSTSSFEVEQSYDIPPGFDVKKLQDAQQAREALAELKKTKPGSTKIKITNDTKAGVLGNGKGRESVIEAEVSPAQAKKAAQAWQEKGEAGALKELGDSEVKFTQTDYKTRGIAAKPKFSFPGGVVSVGGDGGAVTQKNESTKKVTKKAKDLDVG